MSSSSDPPDEVLDWVNKNPAQAKNQLDELNEMERQQDFVLWTSSSLFAATQGILIVALFSANRTPFSMGLLSVIGLLVSFAWIIVAIRARKYERTWICKARRLQKALRIPPPVAIWEDNPPSGIPAWIASATLIG